MKKVELERMQRELDGENSPEESRTLHALLAEDSEAARLYDEFRIVDCELRQAGMVEPPPWLKRNVMNALPAGRRHEGFSFSRFIRDVPAAMQARPALAYAYTFVIGAVFGLGVFAVALQESPANEGELYGAFAKESISDAEALPIQFPGFKGKAEMSTSGQYVIVDLIVEADEMVDVRLVSESSLMLSGFARKAENAATSIDIEGDVIVLGIRGFDRFSVMFNQNESSEPSVRLEIRQKGRLIYEERLRDTES